MTRQSELIRIETDLKEAEAEIQSAETVEGSLGGKLKFGFGALFAAVHAVKTSLSRHDQRIDEHERQLTMALWRITELEKNLHGLKVSRGKAVAAKNRALKIITSAKQTLVGSSIN